MEYVTIEYDGRRQTIKLDVVDHTFGSNQTIDGALKLHNNHGVPPKQFAILVLAFNALNDNRVPRVGQSFRVPVVPRKIR